MMTSNLTAHTLNPGDNVLIGLASDTGLIKSQLIQNSDSSIDLSDFASGVYLFKVTTANGSINKKVIKK